MTVDILYQYWFNRFQVIKKDHGKLYFRDLLCPKGKLLEESIFSDYPDNSNEQTIAFFQKGFLSATVSSVLTVIKASAEPEHEALFWQFPCRTEAQAWENHQLLQVPYLDNQQNLHIYLGLPWATWIDKQKKEAWQGHELIQVQQQLRLLRVYFSGIRGVLKSLGVTLRLHTVCQHIYWRDFVNDWQRLGITDLWLSHCLTQDDTVNDFKLHPWSLFAVNVEDKTRRVGLKIGIDPAKKPLLASFMGAHMTHYLSDIRLRLQQFASEPDFIIKVKQQWHFEKVVYQHQMNQQALNQTYGIDESVQSYNQLLSDSVFSLCPSGAGVNSLRLWESLAVGSIPVLLGDEVCLPNGGNLSMINWDEIVLRISDQQLADLPQILRNISLSERRRRQQLAMEVYQKVRQQRCF